MRRGEWGNMACTTEHALYGAFKVWQSKCVQKGIDEGVDSDKHKMKISQPVNQLTAACMAEIHEINHDTRGNITRQEDSQHDQIGFSELIFHHNSSLTCFVLLALAVVHLVNLSNLVFSVLKNTNVGEKENEDGTEHCNVSKDKSVSYKANDKEHRSETRGEDPDQRCSYANSQVTRVSSVPQRLSDRKVTINSQRCQTQQRRCTAQEIYRLGEP